MKLSGAIIVALLFCILMIINVSASASSLRQLDDFQVEYRKLMTNLARIPGIKPRDYEGIEKYASKMIKSFQKKRSSSKKSDDLIDSIQKYTKKIREIIQNLSCAPEIVVEMSMAVEPFLQEAAEICSFDPKDGPRPSPHFIEQLALMPEGTLASNYVALWHTIDNLESSSGRFSDSESLFMMKSAFQQFNTNLARAISRTMFEEINDPIIEACMIKGSFLKYDEKYQSTCTYIDNKSRK